MSQTPKIVLRGERFNVELRAMRTRSGEHKEREVMVHPGAVVLLPVLDDGRIVLIRNYRFTLDQTLWELPAGTREPKEELSVCAARELEEETGYQAGSLSPLLDFYPSPGVSTERMHVFLAQKLTKTAQRLDDAEQIEVHPMAPEQVRELVRTGQIVDAKTLASLLFYWAHA